METAKLSIQPQIIDLYAVLEQNGLFKQKEEVKSLVGYIEGMEEKLGQMMSVEFQAMMLLVKSKAEDAS